MRRQILLFVILSMLCGGGLFAQNAGDSNEIRALGGAWIFNQGDLRCYEPKSAGAEYFFFRAPATLAASIGLIMPATAATGVLSVTNSGGTMTIATPAELGAASLAADSVATSEILDATIAQVDINDTQTIGADPANGASSVWFSTTGLIAEGATSDTIETLMIFADPAASDKTVTVPNVTGTLVSSGDTATITALMMGADSVGSSEIIESESYTVAGLTSTGPIVANSVNAVVGADSLVAADCGRITTATAGVDTFLVTLPEASTVIGCTLKIVYIGADGGALLDVTPLDSDTDGIEGGCTLAASVVTLSGTADANVKLTKATILTGDFLEVTSVGADLWILTNAQGICAN
jgi:hypothetical protein